MAGSSRSTARAPGPGAARRAWVEDDAGRRPFMRGIVVHSLMSRGVPFDDAYRIASEVRERVRARGVVERGELARMLEEHVGASAPEAARAEPAPRGIRVTGQGGGSPFSKGFLSQSLLAAAIDPHEAFDVARAIEAELLARGVHEMDRHDLRRIAYETLRERVGDGAADRYLVWRAFERSERPVILLLGGTAGAGKTSLAHEVAHRLGIHRVVSTDSIRQVMRIMLSPELVPAIHASSYEAHKVLADRLRGDDPVVEGFRAQAATVSVGVRAMMDRAVSENQHMILDGVSIVPGLVDLEAYAEHAHVIFLLVACLDEEAFRTRFAARARETAHRPPHRYLENLEAILRIQDDCLEAAETEDVPIVQNDSFDASVLSIIRHVTETLRKRADFDAAKLL